MERDAIISPASLGTLGAYTEVIRDISEVLEDRQIDMAKLFYAVMIQSGVERFRTSSHAKGHIPQILVERTLLTDFEAAKPKLDQLHFCLFNNARPNLNRKQAAKLYAVEAFLTELHLAAEFRRPVATCLPIPKMAELEGVLNEDLLMVVDALFSAIETVNLKTPVARLDLPAKDFSAFRKVLSSALFEPYMESHAELEALSKPTATSVEHVSSAARRVVDAFPGSFELRETAVNAIQAVPSLIELTAGKALATLARPIFSTIAEAISRDRRLILYSFEPAWRRVWGGKLDKVRTILARERAAKDAESL